MGRDLYREFSSVKDRFAEAEDVLGLSLTGICFEGPMEVLSQTSVTQPAVFVHSVAAAEVLMAEGLDPGCAAGHSLGEYSALVAAGALSFRQGLELVAERGRLMQEAGERQPGKMAAVIGLEDAEVEALCASVGEGEDGAVVPANFNAPGQVVVSGEAEAVDEFGSRAREAGAKRVVELLVSGAFHSRLMEPAAREMAPLLRDAAIRTSRIPVVTNVRAEPASEGDPSRALERVSAGNGGNWGYHGRGGGSGIGSAGPRPAHRPRSSRAPRGNGGRSVQHSVGFQGAYRWVIWRARRQSSPADLVASAGLSH